MRLVIRSLLLLSQAAVIICTNAQYYEANGQGREAHEINTIAQGESQRGLSAEQNPPRIRQDGADLVDAALIELGRVPKPSYLQAGKSSSVFVSLFRLIIQTIPTSPAAAPSTAHTPSMNSHLSAAVQLLEQATAQNNSDAMYILAELNFFGNYTYPRNLHTAFDHYNQLALNHGNTTAQYMLGLYYSTGLGNVVPRDQAKALLYYTFAAIRGDMKAEMATAFRHHSGIGATKNCMKSVRYYKRVADKAIEWYRSGPPGGRTWVHQAWRIADDDGGIFGEGASASSSGINAVKASPNSDAHAAIGDVIEYLDVLSQQGDPEATYSLGRTYYEGRRGLDVNYDWAKKYFFVLASKYWRRDGRLVENFKPGIEKFACKSAGYIGRMYLRGEGLPQNFERAKVWFERGLKGGDAQSQYGLGLMLLNGLGGKENIKKSTELFRASAEQDYAPARVQLGRLYLDQGGQEDLQIANNHFELAARYGNIEAYYYLAEMVFHGVGREKLCATALTYYKSVAERAEPLVSSWADANQAYENGDYELAFLEYLMAAEQGYEKAQTNIAYMLDTERSRLPFPSLFNKPNDGKGLLQNPELALIHWTRSSRQSNIDSLVKMGDYYFYGIGAEPDVAKAVQCYTGASDYSQSAQALFNLGWMHENGVGLDQDFHLAKRYYDHALQVNQEAYLPVTLSLLKLRIRSAWNTLTHGGVHSIQDEPKPKQDWSLSEWIANFLQVDALEYEDYYNDDLYDGTIGGGNGDLDDSGVIESLLIIGITMSLVFLLWWRQRMQQAHAQAEEARRREQGLPPHPPAANRADLNDGFRGWAAGGAGL